VSAAVRAAGYTSENEGSEFGGEDDEEGSSIEEEGEGEDEGGYVSATEPAAAGEGERLPEYERTNPTAPGGYPIEKEKLLPAGNGHPNANPNSNAENGDAAGVARKPSKRQQEKAPEGREPHVNPTPGPASDHNAIGTTTPNGGAGADAGEGPAPVESRFMETL
jgi:hypothetical protein